MIPPALAPEPYCYLTTRGRRSGKPHTIEIWFGLGGDTLYMLSGGRERSDWVKNILKTSDVKVRIGRTTFAGRGRAVEPDSDEDTLARKLLVEKYAPGYSGSLDNWGKTALPVAIDVSAIVSTDPADALWPRGRRLGG